jgi:filamentous hemagglutinin
VQTQLGGWIGGNPQLGQVPAKVIVNEVLGTSPSALNGVVEVAGRKADVVIANPNGLTCDGCGFINTGRATLSTGTPQYGPQGQLNGFDVWQGQISVGSRGLSAANLEQLDLIARGLVVEGEVWAQNLRVLATTHPVLYEKLMTLPRPTGEPGSENRPLFAIDLKDLGGMYAGQIRLVATEKGPGRELHGPDGGAAGQSAGAPIGHRGER